jgi:hypothetical protein
MLASASARVGSSSLKMVLQMQSTLPPCNTPGPSCCALSLPLKLSYCTTPCCFTPSLLQVVRAELPAVPTAAVGGRAAARSGRQVLPDVAPIADAPDWAKPNRSWVLQFVADFQQLRLQLQQACLQGGEACCCCWGAVALWAGRASKVVSVQELTSQTCALCIASACSGLLATSPA